MGVVQQEAAADTPAASNLGQRVAAGAGWAQIARLAEVGLTFVLTLLFVRLLGPQRYGEYAFIVNAATLGAVILSFGQSETLGRFVSEMVTRNNIAQLRYLVRRLVALRMLGLGAGVLVLLLWHGPIASLLQLPLVGAYWASISLLLAGQVVIEVATGYAYARLRSRNVAAARTVGQLAAVICFVAIVALGWSDPVTATITVTISYLVATAMLSARGLGGILVGGPSTPLDFKPVLNFAMGAWGTNLFTIGLAGQIDVLLLSGYSKGTVQIALYSVATLVFVKVGQLLSGWSSTAVASFAETRATHGDEGTKTLFGIYLRVHLLLALLIYPPIVLLSYPITTRLFGAQYASAAGLMSLYGVFWIAMSFVFSGIPLAFLLAAGYQRQTLMIRGVAGALNLVLDLLLIPPFGALGAVVATGIANVLAYLGDLAVVARHAGVHYPGPYALRVGAASFAASVSVLVISYGSSNIIMSALAALSYYLVFPCILFLVRPFNESDQQLAEKVSPRIGRLLRPLTAHTGR